MQTQFYSLLGFSICLPPRRGGGGSFFIPPSRRRPYSWSSLVSPESLLRFRLSCWSGPLSFHLSHLHGSVVLSLCRRHHPLATSSGRAHLFYCRFAAGSLLGSCFSSLPNLLLPSSSGFVLACFMGRASPADPPGFVALPAPELCLWVVL